MRTLVVLMMVMGMAVGQSRAAFKDCYAKCFVFCMIEPSETLCSCTTRCLKSCIFSDSTNHQLLNQAEGDHQETKTQDFCKLGCAFSMCSGISKKHQPNGDKMDGCVGSCSRMCTFKN